MMRVCDDKGGYRMRQAMTRRPLRRPLLPVLVVEDDEATREALCYLLEDSGYQVSEAANGLRALEYLRANAGHCVVLADWWMPEMDGLRLLDTIAHTPALANRYTFILMTAAYTPALMEQPTLRLLTHQRLLRLLRKPFDIDVVLSLVADAVDEAQDMIGRAQRGAAHSSQLN